MSAPTPRYEQREYKPPPPVRNDPGPVYRPANEFRVDAPQDPPAPRPLIPDYRMSVPSFEPVRTYPAPPPTNQPAWNRPSPYDERKPVDRCEVLLSVIAASC